MPAFVQGSVRLSAGRRAGPHVRGSTGTSCAAVRLYGGLCPPATRTRRWPTRGSSFGDNGGGGDGAPQRLITAWSSLRSTDLKPPST